MRTSCARYKCMGILYYKLVAFIPNTKDVWDFCLGGLNHHPNLTQSLTQSPKTHTKLRMTKPSTSKLLGCPQYAEISWIAATKGIVKSAT
ncbi:hypothetical protein HpMS258_10760 [Helicobacter pylori]